MSNDVSATWPVHNQQTVYPKPDYNFQGARIGLTYADSNPDFPPPDKAPPGAPNILLVLLDDVGFGWMSTFGGLIESPTLERLAQNGLRYGALPHHRPLLADPTPRCLTGRNHHSVGTGVIQEIASGYPRLQRTHPAQHRHRRRGSAPERLRDGLVRQEPQRPRQPDLPRRPVRPLADTTWGSTTSTGSSAARRTSSSRRSTGARRRSKRTRPRRRATS